jgi:hypothetical protein
LGENGFLRCFFKDCFAFAKFSELVDLQKKGDEEVLKKYFLTIIGRHDMTISGD